MIVWNNSNNQVFITCLQWEESNRGKVLVNESDYSIKPGEGIDLSIIGFSCEKNPADAQPETGVAEPGKKE